MSHVSRRSVTKGAAWSIPAISVAASVPALAASKTAAMGADDSLPPPRLRGDLPLDAPQFIGVADTVTRHSAT